MIRPIVFVIPNQHARNIQTHIHTRTHSRDYDLAKVRGFLRDRQIITCDSKASGTIRSRFTAEAAAAAAAAAAAGPAPIGSYSDK
jgi:hypothetical protein